MYFPSLKVKKNGVPIVSKKELDAIGERFVQDFQPDVLTNPAPVDIESFVECYLGMTPDYQFLSHNGIYLGMTVFNDTNNQKHRYRFTLCHEGSHDILHSGFFSYNPNQLSMFDLDLAPMIQCRVDNSTPRKADTKYWDDHDWMEWQANRLASAILMPISAVALLAQKHPKSLKSTKDRFFLIQHTADTFDVSAEAATYRLKELGYIPKDENTDKAAVSAFMDFAPIVTT